MLTTKKGAGGTTPAHTPTSMGFGTEAATTEVDTKMAFTGLSSEGAPIRLKKWL